MYGCVCVKHVTVYCAPRDGVAVTYNAHLHLKLGICIQHAAAVRCKADIRLNANFLAATYSAVVSYTYLQNNQQQWVCEVRSLDNQNTGCCAHLSAVL